MHNLTFLDNPINRMLIGKPESWNNFYDTMVEFIGKDVEFTHTYYQFLEYIGFNKDKIIKPEAASMPIVSWRSQVEIDSIGMILEKNFFDIEANVLGQLLSVGCAEKIQGLMIQQNKYESNWHLSQELKDILFYYYKFNLFNNYSKFSNELATFLTWDYFCVLNYKSVPTFLLRQIQLGIWQQLYQKNTILPFGKIIDDLQIYSEKKLSNKSYFDPKHDMLDSDAITYLITGVINFKNEKRKINFITFDNPLNIKERVDLAKDVIIKLNNCLADKNQQIQMYPGTVYCLLKENLKINEIISIDSI